MKKFVTEMSTEELLKFLEDNKDESTVNYQDPTDVSQFISVYNITSGPEKVTQHLLYKAYKQWSQNPIGPTKFHDNIKDFFALIDGYYSLNKQPLVLKKKINEFKEKRDKTKQQPWKNHFDAFIKHYNIKKGRHFIKDKVLYNLYDKWAYEHYKKKPLTFFYFNKFCRNHFVHKQISRVWWFSVTTKIVNHLSWEHRKIIRYQNAKKD